MAHQKPSSDYRAHVCLWAPVRWQTWAPVSSQALSQHLSRPCKTIKTIHTRKSMYKVIKFLQDALWSSGYMIYTFLSPTPVLLAVASFASSLAVSMGRLLSSHFLSTHKLDRTDPATAHSLLGLANNNSNNNQGSCYHSYRQPDSVKAVQNIICTKFSVIRDIPWSILL